MLWDRDVDVPTQPGLRIAFHFVLIIVSLGGIRPSVMLNLPYKCVEIALVRINDAVHSVATTTVQQNKRRQGKVKDSQDDMATEDSEALFSFLRSETFGRDGSAPLYLSREEMKAFESRNDLKHRRACTMKCGILRVRLRPRLTGNGDMSDACRLSFGICFSKSREETYFEKADWLCASGESTQSLEHTRTMKNPAKMSTWSMDLRASYVGQVLTNPELGGGLHPILLGDELVKYLACRARGVEAVLKHLRPHEADSQLQAQQNKGDDDERCTKEESDGDGDEGGDDEDIRVECDGYMSDVRTEELRGFTKIPVIPFIGCWHQGLLKRWWHPRLSIRTERKSEEDIYTVVIDTGLEGSLVHQPTAVDSQRSLHLVESAVFGLLTVPLFENWEHILNHWMKSFLG
ncbi:hypothetical protein VP1G_04571 [Cytospora mali]|uniref:Uncharacterized protein n=1 Tax=Cytospora mali TaxID=578113 RepID=A0A194V023_CYTMA|nr:hypothetical protein VP1G_04571 [Valsa mali var. pyri (nom. inval.)]